MPLMSGPNDQTPHATRLFGLHRLANFLPRAAQHYGQLRNFDEGPGARQHVSVLSPWISRRLITESEVISQVLTHHPEPECHPFLKEVLWRGYWRSYLEQRPSLWTSYRQMLANRAPAQDRRYHRAISGESGIDVFDEWVRELRSEAYLHNHARLWFASLWIHTLKLPWQWGAAWFLEQLLDGDAASNTLSWRWVAGLHTKGKAYAASPENIAKFTRHRLQPQLPHGACTPVDETEAYPQIVPQLAPELAPQAVGPDDGILFLGDDLSLDRFAALVSHPPSAAAWVAADLIGSAYGWSERVRCFHEHAIKDASHRIQTVWPKAQCHVTPTSDHELHQFFLEWRRLGIKRILVPMPHQGPYRDVWNRIRSFIHGFEVRPFNRHYDIQLAPLGQKGFFDFWQRRPSWQQLCQD